MYPKYTQDLFSLLHGGALGDKEAARITARVLVAATDLHRIGLVHLDLKHENILLTEKNTPIVADFGFARCARADAPSLAAALSSGADAASSFGPSSLRFTAGAQASSESSGISSHHIPACSEYAGGDCYCAARREVLQGEPLPQLPAAAFGVKPRDISLGAFSPPQCWLPVSRIDGRKADGFAVGVIASYCLSQLGVGIDLAKRSVVLADFAPHVSTAAIDFVRTATAFDETNRPLPEELLQHPWVAVHVAELQSEAASLQRGCARRWWEPAPARQQTDVSHPTPNQLNDLSSDSVSDCDSDGDVSLGERCLDGERGDQHALPSDDYLTPIPKSKLGNSSSCNSLGHLQGTACDPRLPNSGVCSPLTCTQSDGGVPVFDQQRCVPEAQDVLTLGKQLAFDTHSNSELLRCASG